MQYTQAVFHRSLSPPRSALKSTEGTQISLKFSWILSLVSIFFFILNSCDAVKSQCASQQKRLRFRNERNNCYVQFADEFVMCSGILFQAVNSNYISSCAQLKNRICHNTESENQGQIVNLLAISKSRPLHRHLLSQDE